MKEREQWATSTGVVLAVIGVPLACWEGVAWLYEAHGPRAASFGVAIALTLVGRALMQLGRN